MNLALRRSLYAKSAEHVVELRRGERDFAIVLAGAQDGAIGRDDGGTNGDAVHARWL